MIFIQITQKMFKVFKTQQLTMNKHQLDCVKFDMHRY